MKPTLRTAIWTMIALAVLIRFLGLEHSPPGFYIDEAFGAAHSLCYQQTGFDFFNQRQIFSRIDYGGYQSSPFIILGAIWTKIFGVGFTGFRSFIAFVGSLTIFGIYFLMRGLYPVSGKKSESVALWAALFAATLPWAFHFSRISWDAPLATCFMVWGLALVYFKRDNSRVRLLCGGILLGLASYTYSPMRIQIALLTLFLPGIPWLSHFIVAAVVGTMNIPVLFYYLDPEFTARSKMLALNSSYYGNPYRYDEGFSLLFDFFAQVLQHFSPQFLVGTGDHNLRHSIQTYGMLDWVTAVGFAIAVLRGVYFAAKRKFSAPVLLLCLGLFSGIAPAALTWEGVPHAIRGMGGWPFIVMLASIAWVWIFKTYPKLRYATCATSAVLFGFYLHSYFTEYPAISEAWFDQAQVEGILKSKTYPSSYGPIPRAYYEMAFFGKSCADLRISR